MKPICTLILLLFSIGVQGQASFKNAFSFNIDYGFTNDFTDGSIYHLRMFPDKVLVDRRFSERVRNFSFGYSRFFDPVNGLKVSMGVSRFGFEIKGKSQIFETDFEGS